MLEVILFAVIFTVYCMSESSNEMQERMTSLEDKLRMAEKSPYE